MAYAAPRNEHVYELVVQVVGFAVVAGVAGGSPPPWYGRRHSYTAATTSRHRRQREQIAAASRAGPRKARLQKGAAGRGGCRREARDGTSDSPRGALGTSYVRLGRAWGRQRMRSAPAQGARRRSARPRLPAHAARSQRTWQRPHPPLLCCCAVRVACYLGASLTRCRVARREQNLTHVSRCEMTHVC